MSLSKDFTIVGLATLLSRLTGFVRDILIAAVLGSGAVADAYIVAFLLPNFFRRVISEGAFNAAFVPIFARRREESGAAGAQAFAEAALSSFVALILGLLLLVQFAMPVFIAALAPGFVAIPEKFDNAVLFSRIAFVFVGFVLLVALLSAVLNAINRFALVALAPVILNVMLIGVLVALWILGTGANYSSGLVLVVTVAVAGFVQLAYVWHALSRSAFPLKLQQPSFGPDIRRLLLLALPGMAIAGSGHLNLLLASQLSTALPSAVSWLYYADRIFQLPLSFVSAAIGVVLLPEVARSLRAGDQASARTSNLRALEFGLLLVLPAAASLLILAGPIVGIIYERGMFLASDSMATAEVLRSLAFALPGFVLVAVLLPPYLARESFKVPLIAGLCGLVANVVVAVGLFSTKAHTAAPLGVAVSAWVNAAILFAGLGAVGHLRFDSLARRRLPAILLSAGCTAALVQVLSGYAAGWLEAPTPLALRAGVLALICCFGVVSHLLLASITGAVDPGALRSMFSRQKNSHET